MPRAVENDLARALSALDPRVCSVFATQLMQFGASPAPIAYGSLMRIDSTLARGWMWSSPIEDDCAIVMLCVKMNAPTILEEKPETPYAMLSLVSAADMKALRRTASETPDRSPWDHAALEMNAPFSPGLENHVMAATMHPGSYAFPLETDQVYRAANVILFEPFLDRNPEAAAAFEETNAPISLDESLELREILRSLSIRHASKPGASLFYSGKMREAIGGFAAYRHDEAMRRQAAGRHADEDIVGAAKTVLSETIDEPLTISELAGRLYVGRTYLCETFKRVTGESIGAYGIRLRMRKAEELLAFSEETIDDVARQVGFKHRSGLCAAFRRETGMTPSAWRRNRT